MYNLQLHTDYCVGFLFTGEGDNQRTILVRKQRPEWQKGRLNGPGGKVEGDETFAQAMRREFREECGVDIDTWELALTLVGKDFRVGFLRAFAARNKLDECSTQTDEMIISVRVDDLDHWRVIDNLRWIIPFCANPCTQLPIIVWDAPSNKAKSDAHVTV